jgi:hypothetical protein
MKFIRDIIAERSNLAGADSNKAPKSATAEPENQERAESRPQEIDQVDMVASGSRSLGRDDLGAFHAELDANDLENKNGDPDTGLDEDGGFDLLSDDEETVEPGSAGVTGTMDAQEAVELFADLWAEDMGKGAAPEEDIFAAEASVPVAEDTSVAPPTPEPDPEPDPAPDLASDPVPEPETNAEALMRTMYRSEPMATEEQHPGQTAEMAMPDVPSDQFEAEAHEEIQNTSAFHRILQRQEAMPSSPTPEVASVPEHRTEPVPEPMISPTPAGRIMRDGAEPIKVPTPAAGRSRRQAGRVKTRLLGFGSDQSGGVDMFARPGTPEPAAQSKFPVGWMVVVSGPGRGTAFTLFDGVSQIGRGEDQAVRLDFGDNSISRANHAAIAYDPEQKGFFLGHGGKANLVRLNGNPVLSTEPLHNGALIRIGETTLRFVGLCGDEFDWGKTQDEERDNARFG